MIKKLFIYILSILTLISMVGCSSSGSISTFTIGITQMPKNLDPQIATSEADIMVLNNIFDGLFEIIDQKAVPNLVKDYTTSSNGRVYTFNLREDSYYSFNDSKNAEKKFDGTPVTAHDFVYAFQRILSQTTKSPYSDNFMNIKNAVEVYNGANANLLGVTALNDYTLKIELVLPDYNFIQTLSLSAVYPCNKDFFESTQGAYGLSTKTILSNGPFRLNYLSQEEGAATLIRVREDKNNSLQRLRLKQVTDGEQSTLYENEKISGFFDYNEAKANYANTNTLSFSSANTALVFNMNNPLLANEKIRQALAWYAFGYENSGANMSAVKPSYSIFPDIMTWSGENLSSLIDISKPSYMQKNAKDLLIEGLKECGVLKMSNISVLMPSDSMYTVIYENINQLWQKELSQFFSVEILTTSQINERIAQNKYDIAFTLLNPSHDSPYAVLDNYSEYSNDLSQLIELSKQETDSNSALKYIQQSQNILLDKAMVVPIGKEYTNFYYRKYYTNIKVNPFGFLINLKYATSN